MCICVYPWFCSSPLFKHVRLNIKDTFCLYDFIRMLSGFLRSVLLLDWRGVCVPACTCVLGYV